MKRNKTYIINILAILIICTSISCHRNKLKTDEKKLTSQIKTEEEQRAYEQQLRLEKEQQLADSLAKLPKAFRLEEDRSIDPTHPPVIIDIEASREMPIVPVKVSDLFKNVQFTRLQQDPDSLLTKTSGRVVSSNNHLYLRTRWGSIIQYDKDGNFTQYICKSKLHYDPNKPFDRQIIRIEGASMPYLFNNKLYYKYENQINRKSYFLCFDENKGISIDLKNSIQEEKANPIRGKGDIILDFNTSSKKPHYSTNVFFINKNIIAYTSTRKVLSRQDNIVNLKNSKGDTICAFPDHDKITNYTGSTYRGVEDGTSYYFNGILHVRQAFNDTIYQVIPPNRLVPKYIINFGAKGLQSSLEAVNPHFDLSQKLIMQDILETNRYLFITYSQNYTCPNNSDKVKFSRVIFDKKNKKLIPIYTDEKAYISGKGAWPFAPQVNIKNDIGDIPFFWPYSTTPQGNPITEYNGDDINKIKQCNWNKNEKVIAIFYE